MKTTRFISVVFILLLTSQSVVAGGPKRIATSDRALWPEPLNSHKEFNLASRAEIIAIAHAWLLYSSVDSSSVWVTKLSIKKVNLDSIKLWEASATKRWLENFRTASISCIDLSQWFCSENEIDTWEKLVNFSDQQWNNLPISLKDWAAQQTRFYTYYLYEQYRLAALFPRITSEILQLDQSEITGSEFPDKSFLLTFDDGPSRKFGETDKLITLLRKNDANGIFFMLGEKINSRIKNTNSVLLKKLYKGMCIESHGNVHKSHQRIKYWKKSLDTTNKLLSKIIPVNQSKLKYFRPPYGQRTAEINQYLLTSGQQVMLWNIDSQDWNRKVTPKQISGRVITLMLLWRKGILLFHDIHSKARNALPEIFKLTKSGVYWVRCNDIYN